MKKSLCAMLIFLSLVALRLPGRVGAVELVDAYSSASLTKSYVEGEELTQLASKLSAWGADIATRAQREAPGYKRMYDKNAQIMTVNPDGSVGLSTIANWRYANNSGGQEPFKVIAGPWAFSSRGEGNDQVIIQLTYGQNAININRDDARATLLVKDGENAYLLHLKLTDRHEQVFDQAAYEAGEFAATYVGSGTSASSFYFIFNVMSIEKSSTLLFD